MRVPGWFVPPSGGGGTSPCFSGGHDDSNPFFIKNFIRTSPFRQQSTRATVAHYRRIATGMSERMSAAFRPPRPSTSSSPPLCSDAAADALRRRGSGRPRHGEGHRTCGPRRWRAKSDFCVSEMRRAFASNALPRRAIRGVGGGRGSNGEWVPRSTGPPVPSALWNGRTRREVACPLWDPEV